MTAGWWRRNRWGLAALLPALVAAVGPDLHSVYDRYWNTQPRRPISAGADGWVAFAGARMRLAELTLAEELKEYGGRAFKAPRGVRVWRADIVFDGAGGNALGGCRLALEDEAGRTFDANPSELGRVRAPLAGCTPPATPPAAPDPSVAPSPSAARTEYETRAYFVMPASARPVALRVTLLDRLPAYARLSGG